MRAIKDKVAYDTYASFSVTVMEEELVKDRVIN